MAASKTRRKQKEIEGTIIIQVGENNVLERSSEKLSCSSEEIGLTD